MIEHLLYLAQCPLSIDLIAECMECERPVAQSELDHLMLTGTVHVNDDGKYLLHRLDWTRPE